MASNSFHSLGSSTSSETPYSAGMNNVTFRPTSNTSGEDERPTLHGESDTPTFDLGLDDVSSSEVNVESQVYLSVVWNCGKLGAAYYDTDTTEIYMLPDSVESDSFHLLRTILRQIQPRCIAASTKQDERLLQAIQSMTPCHLADELDGYLVLLPSIDFSSNICKRRVLYQDLPTIPKHFNDTERTLYMSSLVDFDQVNMVRATGGLLKLLEKKRAGIELEDHGTRVPVLALKTFSLNNIMLVDDNTYSALQIFHLESHPSVYKSGTGREGLSLFRLLNRCRSIVGSKLLRLWFLQPLRDLQELQERQDAVAFFQNPRNFEVTSVLQKCLKKVRNISRVLVHMTQAHASAGDWNCLYQTISNLVNIKDVCKAQNVDCPIFTKIDQLFSGDLDKITQEIQKVVDFEQLAAQNRFVAKSGIADELDSLRRSLNDVPEIMRLVANDEATKLPDDIRECSIIYLPQKGYLLSLASSDGQEVAPRDFPGLTYIFKGDGCSYYKNEAIIQMDEMLGGTLKRIHDIESSIMHLLQYTVLKQTKMLLNAVQCAAELDCLISLGTSAREQNYCRPKLSKDNVLLVIQGRHPLQELCCSSYVSNDTCSGGGHSKMKLLTGPNASGKSVYLKQVSLIVYMAQIGSFVPAESAEIGLVDGIFSRICTMESVSVGLSAFMIDLNQMSTALRTATQKSLVVIDEFGKGTDTEDGVSLLCSCLHYWLAKEEKCPHVFVSSHFHNVIQQHLLPETPLLQNQTMATMQDGAEMVFLYKLVEGSTDQSFACHVAVNVGLPEKIITRGAEVSDLIRENKPVNRLDGTSTETQNKRYKAIISRFLDLNLDEENLEDFLQNYVLPCSNGKLSL